MIIQQLVRGLGDQGSVKKEVYNFAGLGMCLSRSAGHAWWKLVGMVWHGEGKGRRGRRDQEAFRPVGEVAKGECMWAVGQGDLTEGGACW